MSILKRVCLVLIAVCGIFFFTSCKDGNDSNNNTSNPSLPPIETDIIDDNAAKNYLGKSVDIILDNIAKMNELSETTRNDFQSTSSITFNITNKIETILNSSLIAKKESEIFKEKKLKKDKLYAMKTASDGKQFAMLSVALNNKKISFTIILDGDNVSNKFEVLVIDSEIENSNIVSVKFNCANTDSNGNNLSLYGFVINAKEETFELYHGQPILTGTDAITFLTTKLDNTSYDSVKWNTYIFCRFDFSNDANLKFSLSSNAVFGNPPNQFKQTIINANFSENTMKFFNFDSIFEDNKHEVISELFQDFDKNTVSYDKIENKFNLI